MKKRLTIICGFLVVIFALTFTACFGSGGGISLNSAEALKKYIDKQPFNSPDKPIKVAMKANELMLWSIVGVLSFEYKYVSLNLSGSPLTAIPYGIFRDCKTLVGITIPNSVTSIEGAFSYCTGLTSITIPDSVTSIGKSAFEGCTSLTSIAIPNSVTSIWYSAFESCTSLTSITIPNSVTSIGDGAFAHCTSLTSITIPNSVTSIGLDAFAFCTSLIAINVDSGNSAYSQENGVLYNKDKTTIVNYPEGKTDSTFTIPNGVTSIGESAFEWCTSLTSVTIPNSVTSIGAGAFNKCFGLTSVTIPNSVTSIGRYAFLNSGLTSVTIGNGVASIGGRAFSACTSLTSVTVSRRTRIEDYDFPNNVKITYSD